MSNIQRAQMKRLTLCIVRSGNPIRRPPEGRLDYGNETTKRRTERFVFQARKRYFVPQRLFFAYFFLTSQKKVCPRSDAAPIAAEKIWHVERQPRRIEALCAIGTNGRGGEKR